jgi:hypothetical protein
VIAWWELRRIPYNLLMLVYGLAAWFVCYFGMSASGELHPGDDIVEPIITLLVPLVANACYTLGWIVDLAVHPSRPRFGASLFKLGFGFSLFIIGLPAVIWGVVGLLHLVHVFH